MTAGRRARGARALLPAERRGLLRVELLALYDADPEVRAALKDIAARQPDYRYGPEYHAFDAEIVALAERFGLHLLRGGDGVNVAGVELLRRWARLRLGPGDLTRAATFGIRTPDLAAGAAPTYGDLESRQAFEERTREYADRVERDRREAGYIFPDTTPRLRDHVRWLFLRIRYGMTWPAIANAEAVAVTDDAIRQAVRRLAVDIGADVERCGRSPRQGDAAPHTVREWSSEPHDSPGGTSERSASEPA